MTRNLKILGLALVAALAMSAVAASAASATAFQFHSETSSTTLTGSQHASNDKFVIDAGTTECTNATYTGTQSTATTSSVTVTPAYSGCTSTFGLGVNIDVNGCAYIFTAKTIENGNREGTVDIECPTHAGPPHVQTKIEVTAPGCTVTVPPQTGLAKATFTNVGAGKTREVTVDVSLTGVTYEEHNKGIFPTCKNNTILKHNGTYTGAGLVTGESGGAHVGIFTG